MVSKPFFKLTDPEDLSCSDAATICVKWGQKEDGVRMRMRRGEEDVKIKTWLPSLMAQAAMSSGKAAVTTSLISSTVVNFDEQSFSNN